MPKRLCSVDGCGRVNLARTYCSKHYQRWKVHGSPEHSVKQTEQHGLTGTPEYISWQAMKQRCYYKKNKRYASYGGKGIKVCERWKDSFNNFLEDMGEKPGEKHTVDRIDVNGDYTPENCRWATTGEQSLNKGLYRSNKSGHKGIYWSKYHKRWYAQIRRKGVIVWSRRFENMEDAIKSRKKGLELYETTN